MSKKSTTKIANDAPVTQADTASGRLVLRKRGAGGTVLPAKRDPDMKKTSTSKNDQNIPELKREQFGVGVRGKYFKQFTQGSNVVVLQPEIKKAFPTSDAVNKALASMLAFTQEAQTLTHPKRTPRKRA